MAAHTDRVRAAVIDPARAEERIDIGRRDPAATLAPNVDYLWWVRWSTPEEHRQQVIPRAVVHVAAEVHGGEPRLVVHGIRRAMFERRLEGEGRTVAAAFRPGGFRPFLRADVRTLQDREVPAADVLGVDDREVAGLAVDLAVPLEDACGALEAWLDPLAPPGPDPLVDELAALVDRAETDPTITRAEQLAELAGVTLRTLQRQCSAYVGIGPKWIVQRCRLLDVAAAAHADEPVDWAALAADLGYADQSHLIRAFTSLVGRPPAAYAAGA